MKRLGHSLIPSSKLPSYYWASQKDNSGDYYHLLPPLPMCPDSEWTSENLLGYYFFSDFICSSQFIGPCCLEPTLNTLTCSKLEYLDQPTSQVTSRSQHMRLHSILIRHQNNSCKVIYLHRNFWKDSRMIRNILEEEGKSENFSGDRKESDCFLQVPKQSLANTALFQFSPFYYSNG